MSVALLESYIEDARSAVQAALNQLDTIPDPDDYECDQDHCSDHEDKQLVTQDFLNTLYDVVEDAYELAKRHKETRLREMFSSALDKLVSEGARAF